MARIGIDLLDQGRPFPHLDLRLVDGTELSIPEGLRTPWTILLFYRGSWCPMCRAQLKSFQVSADVLAGLGATVIAASADPLEKAEEMRDAVGATFAMAYGLPVKETAFLIDAYYDPTPPQGREVHLQATGFLLGPGGKIVTVVYSSGAIGRLTWEETSAVMSRANAAAAAAKA